MAQLARLARTTGSGEPLGPDVICVGEALVDFLPLQTGRPVREVATWERHVGGSLANVAIGIARLGGASALLGVVGDDELGHFLKDSIAAEGVDSSRMRQTNEGKTALAFVSLAADGERTFDFYFTRAAEYFLDERDRDDAFLAAARAIHLGSNSLCFERAQATAVRIADAGRANGQIVSCDPNLRLALWPDPSVLRALLRRLLPGSALVKLARDEIEFVTGATNTSAALETLAGWGILLPIVTAGRAGATFRWQGQEEQVASPSVSVVDTTGAGDAFEAALLFCLTRAFANQAALERARLDALREMVVFACQVAALCVTRRGAVTGLPRRADLEQQWPQMFATP